jgi:hypothetical protein
MKNLIKPIFAALCLLLSLQALALEVSIKDLIYFEEKIESLLDESIVAGDIKKISLNIRFNKIHNFNNNFAHQLLNELLKNKPLNGYQLSILKLSFGAYLTLAERLDAKLSGFKPNRAFNGSDREIGWLISSINLLQNYKQTYELLYKSTHLRRVLKDQSLDQDSNIKNIEKITKKIMNKGRVKALAKYTESFIVNSHLNKNFALRSQLKSTNFYKKVDLEESISEFYDFKSFGISLSDGFANTTGTLTSGLSAGFGALVGPVEWREGRLYKNSKAQKQLLSKLKPLDLLLEKKSFKLTDYTIPGHWGHIAVWLGNEEQLREIGMWNHSVIIPFQEKIKEGYSIYEVRRWGLVWDKLEHWLNLDAVAVIRHKQVANYKELEYSKVFKGLFSQIGKKYDYSFDAMTANTITCTEIISLSYGPVNWPTTKVIGRHTLQPDNIASLVFYNNSPVELVAYLKGTEKGYAFESEQKFSSLVGFRKKKNTSGNFEKKFRKCKREKYRSNRRGGIRFKSSCWSYYKSFDYLGPINHLEENEL